MRSKVVIDTKLNSTSYKWWLKPQHNLLVRNRIIIVLSKYPPCINSEQYFPFITPPSQPHNSQSLQARSNIPATCVRITFIGNQLSRFEYSRSIRMAHSDCPGRRSPGRRGGNSRPDPVAPSCSRRWGRAANKIESIFENLTRHFVIQSFGNIGKLTIWQQETRGKYDRRKKLNNYLEKT